MTRPQPADNLALALSCGDPAGIGPEIAIMAWQGRAELELSPFAVFGDPDVLRARARQIGVTLPLVEIATARDAAAAFGAAMPVVPVRCQSIAVAGKPDSANAAAVIGAIEQATAAVALGEAAALVTNPIAKEVLYAAGFKHPGHTELLGELSAKHWPQAPHAPVMMLACDDLRVVPLTIHVALARVPGLLSVAKIVETAEITAVALQRDFAIPKPRIAIAGLNPHAGEGGSMGREEIEIIAPAVEVLRKSGVHVSGPHSADTLFHAEARKRYDAAVCMYHDQALIPIKTIAFDDGVNVTLGLPLVRTSPDHGTAFDIAGQGRARPQSLIAALRMARRMADARLAAGRSTP